VLYGVTVRYHLLTDAGAAASNASVRLSRDTTHLGALQCRPGVGHSG